MAAENIAHRLIREPETQIGHGAHGNRASVFHFYLAGARIASSLSGVVSTLSKCG